MPEIEQARAPGAFDRFAERASDYVSEAGFFSRMIDDVKLWMH